MLIGGAMAAAAMIAFLVRGDSTAAEPSELPADRAAEPADCGSG